MLGSIDRSALLLCFSEFADVPSLAADPGVDGVDVPAGEDLPVVAEGGEDDILSVRHMEEGVVIAVDEADQPSVLVVGKGQNAEDIDGGVSAHFFSSLQISARAAARSARSQGASWRVKCL